MAVRAASPSRVSPVSFSAGWGARPASLLSIRVAELGFRVQFSLDKSWGPGAVSLSLKSKQRYFFLCWSKTCSGQQCSSYYIVWMNNLSERLFLRRQGLENDFRSWTTIFVLAIFVGTESIYFTKISAKVCCCLEKIPREGWLC